MTMLSILGSARIASRLARVDALDVKMMPHDAVVEAVEAMKDATEAFEALAALCAAGARKLELAAWNEPCGPAN